MRDYSDYPGNNEDNVGHCCQEKKGGAPAVQNVHALHANAEPVPNESVCRCVNVSSVCTSREFCPACHDGCKTMGRQPTGVTCDMNTNAKNCDTDIIPSGSPSRFEADHQPCEEIPTVSLFGSFVHEDVALLKAQIANTIDQSPSTYTTSSDAGRGPTASKLLNCDSLYSQDNCINDKPSLNDIKTETGRKIVIEDGDVDGSLQHDDKTCSHFPPKDSELSSSLPNLATLLNDLNHDDDINSTKGVFNGKISRSGSADSPQLASQLQQVQIAPSPERRWRRHPSPGELSSDCQDQSFSSPDVSHSEECDGERRCNGLLKSSEACKSPDTISQRSASSFISDGGGGSHSDEQTQPLVRRRNQELTLCVNTSNSRLSKVLENIPLIYIPHTKQLLSASQTNQTLGSESRSGTRSVDAVSLNQDLGPEGQLDYAGSLSTEQNSQSGMSGVTDPEFANTLTDLDTIDRLEGPRDTLHRTNTSGSLSRTDASSFSSISSISTGTDFSISAASIGDEYLDMKGKALVIDSDEAGFMDVNLHARNTYEKSHSHTSSLDSGIDEKIAQGIQGIQGIQAQGAKPKRKGLTSFLSRNIFSRKSKDQTKLQDQASAPGWKLFGKVPPKQTAQKDASRISEEYQAKVKICQQSPTRTRKRDIEVLSTTALILENRPMNLPPKSAEEAEQHRQEYEAMVEAARKKELKEAKMKKKHLQHQLRLEEQLAAAVKIWNQEILPNWENMRSSKKARELWWLGIPPSVRGKVWKLAIGNELNLTSELYDICLSRAKDRLKIMDENNGESETEEPSSSKESSVELIKLDVSRTFPQLCIFQKGGPYHDMLHSLLGAYACYRPDVGYVQGMSFIAAVLLLNMDVADAFICFANLLNKPCQVAFFRVDETLMKTYFLTYEDFFQENLPKLFAHFQKQHLTPDLYIIDWMFTLYSKSLPLDVASRAWDVFCRDGEEVLFRTALGILKLYEDILLNMDFIHLAQFLTKLPEDITSEDVFRSIDKIRMMVDNKKFAQVLSQKKDSFDAS